MSLLKHSVAWLVVGLAMAAFPGNAQVPLAISDFHVDAVGRAVVRVPSETGFYFILYRGDQITAIQAATDVESLPSAGHPPSVELIDARPPAPVPSRFYRVERVSMAAPKDADGDGVDDAFELNSRPLLDPLDPSDAALDPDNDGRSTLEEYRAGTHPFVANPPPAPASPRLNPSGSSTTAGRLELTGFGAANTYIRVEGGAALATNRVGADGAFSLLVPLSTNRINRLFVTAVNPDGNTSPGVPIEILQDSQPPTVHVDFPTNRMTLTTANTLVAGRVGDSLSGYAGLSVWVHASPAEGNPPLASTSFPPNSPFQATVDVGIGPNGTFERGDVPLVEGTNIVSVVAMDALGNRTVRRAEVIRRPLVGPRLVIRSGDRQMTNVLRRLEQLLVVRAENADGSPVPNVLLTLDVTRSDGRLLPADTNALASDWTLQPNATTNGAMVVQVRTDANGEAAAWWTLGSEAGCANNRVCVASATLGNSVFFCASAMGNPARQINIGSGNHQKVETGGSTVEPLRAWVSDGLNPAAGIPVTFRVVEGNGRLVEGGRDGMALPATSPQLAGAGPDATSLTVATGRTGHASVGFIAGTDAGQNVIEASFPGQFGLPATFIVYGVARDLTQPATFTGLILDNTSCPIGNAHCELQIAHVTLGTLSDSQGRFRFENVPGGMGHLRINGRTATSLFTNTIPTNSFPSLHYSVTTVPNAENSLPSPVLLPRLNPANAHVYDGTKDLVLTCEGIDGLKMTIRANSMRDPQGNPVTPANPMVVSLDQVHHDDVPMPMPDGVAPAFAWTLQPGGATFDPPVAIEYPNMSGLPPGSIAYFLSFNHDTERFEIVSSGHITSDGSTIVTDPGSGLTLAGWGCNCPPYSVTGECKRCESGAPIGGSRSAFQAPCTKCQDGDAPSAISSYNFRAQRNDSYVTRRLARPNPSDPPHDGRIGNTYPLTQYAVEFTAFCDGQLWRLAVTRADIELIYGEDINQPHVELSAISKASCADLALYRTTLDFLQKGYFPPPRMGDITATHESVHALRYRQFFAKRGAQYLNALNSLSIPLGDARSSEEANRIIQESQRFMETHQSFTNDLAIFGEAEALHLNEDGTDAFPTFITSYQTELNSFAQAVAARSIQLGCSSTLQNSFARENLRGRYHNHALGSLAYPVSHTLETVIQDVWIYRISNQDSIISFSSDLHLSNISAPDLFGEEGPSTVPDFVGDDPIRVIGHRLGGSKPRYAFSDFFRLRQGQTYFVTNLTFTDIPPRQADRMHITALGRSLVAGGDTHQLQVTATYADGTSADVTPRTAWTSYRLSNPALASLSPDGLLTPKAPGTVFVTAMNEAATAVRAFTLVDAAQSLTGIAGTVVAESGAAVAGARVVVEPLEGIESMTDAAGRFELRGVPIPAGGAEIRISSGAGTDLSCALVSVSAAANLVVDVGVIRLRPVPPPPGPNLLAWWSGDIGLKDSAGTNDLVIRGAGAMADGIIGDGFSFPTRGSYFEGPQVGSYAISNQLTVAAWVKASALVASQVIVSQYDSSIRQESWSFGFRNGVLVMNSQFGDFRNFREWQSRAPVLVPNQWMFFAASLDMASTNIQLFVDGVRVETQVWESTSQYWAELRRSTAPVRLGASIIASGRIDSLFQGEMDEVCLWVRALSASEIADLYRRSCREPRIATLEGRILASDGRPISGSRVSVSSMETFVETDAEGRFSIEQVPLGSSPVRLAATALESGTEMCAGTEVILNQPGKYALGDLVATRTEEPPREQLIGWWSANQGLEDGAETNALRAIGDQRIGAGRIGTGLRMDGTTGFFSAPWSQTGTLSNQLSFATWLKMESTVPAQAIASQHASIIRSDIGWYFGNSGKKVQLWLYETGWGGRVHLIETRDEVLVDGEWTWLGFSVDTEANRVVLMVNGQVVAQASDTGPIPWNRFNATVTPVLLGGYLGIQNNMLGMLRGNMDEVMLWRRALTVEELAAVARRGCGVVGVNLGSE